jgi:hypothetical protein
MISVLEIPWMNAVMDMPIMTTRRPVKNFVIVFITRANRSVNALDGYEQGKARSK